MLISSSEMQHDLRPQAGGSGGGAQSSETQPGRTTHAQHLKGATLSPAEQKQAAGKSPPPDATDAWPGDDVTGNETIYSDRYHDPHSKRFEQKRHDAPDAKTDEFNKPNVRNDPATRDTAARPGGVVPEHGHNHGIFDIKPAEATRYLYVCRDGRNVAYPVDLVEKRRLIKHNPKAHGGEVPKGKQRLLLNPAEPQQLYLPGETKPEWCVLSWLEGMTAAWIKVSDLDAGKHITETHIRTAIAARAQAWNPDKAGKSSGEIEKHSKRFVFRNDGDVHRRDAHGHDHVTHGAGQADAKDRGHYKGKHDKKATDHPRVLASGQRGGDNVTHYLNKDLRKPAFDAEGHRKHQTHIEKDAAGNPVVVEDKAFANVTRSLVSICMNLPEGHVPPVAIDTATAGESFFVMNDPKFHRDVPVFANGAKHSDLVEKWVFGHLAKRSGGELVPDENRRGWVPFRVLAETGLDDKHHQKLHVDDSHEQRKPKP